MTSIFEVQAIKEKKIINNQFFYKVIWKGLDYCTWEPYENLKNLSFDFIFQDKELCDIKLNKQ